MASSKPWLKLVDACYPLALEAAASPIASFGDSLSRNTKTTFVRHFGDHAKVFKGEHGKASGVWLILSDGAYFAKTEKPLEIQRNSKSTTETFEISFTDKPTVRLAITSALDSSRILYTETTLPKTTSDPTNAHLYLTPDLKKTLISQMMAGLQEIKKRFGRGTIEEANERINQKNKHLEDKALEEFSRKNNHDDAQPSFYPGYAKTLRWEKAYKLKLREQLQKCRTLSAKSSRLGDLPAEVLLALTTINTNLRDIELQLDPNQIDYDISM